MGIVEESGVLKNGEIAYGSVSKPTRVFILSQSSRADMMEYLPGLRGRKGIAWSRWRARWETKWSGSTRGNHNTCFSEAQYISSVNRLDMYQVL